MKKFFQKCAIPVILTITLSLSFMVVPTNAFVAEATVIVDTVVKGFNTIVNSVELLQKLESFIFNTSPETAEGEIWKTAAQFNQPANRLVISYDELLSVNKDLRTDPTFNSSQFETALRTMSAEDGTFWVIELRPCYKLTLPDGTELGAKNRTLVTYGGYILCAEYNETGDDDAHENGKWIKYTSLPSHRIVSLDFLTDAAEYQRIQGYDCEVVELAEGWVLSYSTGTAPYGVRYVYCSQDGYAYVAPADDRVVNGDRDHVGGDVTIDENTGDIIVNGDENIDVGININDGVLNLPDGVELDILQTIYDEATKTYYVDAIDQSTNITNNYMFVFNIDYTSITYIGQTEEYNKYYEVYYELPDGRSSADLTAEELEQLNVSIDIIPYIRSADDVSIRALYHFDGDTRDSSYWSYAGDFAWNSGASITYMDAGVFNGALYLNETKHEFDVTLPSNITMADFTLQFRYYQSYTAAPQLDSYILIGGNTILQLDGANIKSRSGSALAPVDVGNWQEICIMRSGGTLYYFKNGVKLGTVSYSSALSNVIKFVFGDTQQTYKYLDEFRFTSKAIYPISGYEVSSVPFDTNLALVLPDSKVPVADAYWSIKSSKENLLASSGMHDWMNGKVDHLSNIYNFTESQYMTEFNSPYWWCDKSWANTLYNSSHFPTWSRWDTMSEASVYENYGVISTPTAWKSENGGTAMNHLQARFSSTYNTSSSHHFWLPTGGLMTLMAYRPYNGTDSYYLSKGTYTFSMVDTNGEVGSVSFSIPTLADKTSYASPSTKTIDFNGYRIGMVVTYPRSNTNQFGTAVWLVVQPLQVGTENPFMYLELVSGSGTDLDFEYVENVAVMDKSDLHTPSLAVKTDLEITGHQIGGMRPSLPYKGLVWALVEGGVIKSLQIYNGSAWEAVDGRIWTGSRWVPYSVYNVLLMKDLYDIDGVVTPDDYEYIYTEEGFWSWLQKWLNDFKTALFGRLDQIIDGTGSGSDSSEDDASDCEHAYAIDYQSDPTCTDPGKTVYSCPMCGDSYTEYVDALDHDWVEQAHVADSYHLPVGVTCPTCSGTNFLPTLSGDVYFCTCLDCQATWEEDAVKVTGYTLYECSRCGEQRKEHNDSDSNLFEAIGNFLSDGVVWISDKLQQLVNSLSGISDIFTNMAETIKQYAGDYSGLFGQFLALMPADLMTVVWFGLVIMVALLVWKKWFS